MVIRRTLAMSAAVCSLATACTSGSDATVSVPAARVTTTIDITISTTVAPAPTSPPVEQATTAAPTTEPAPTTVESTVAPTSAPLPTTSTPPTTSAPVFYSQGDEGPEIELMQLKLATVGFLTSSYTSGVFDAATNTALRNFQGQYGLGVDGVFGPLTDRALTAAANSVNVDEA